MKMIKNKYKKWYFSLIRKCSKRILPKEIFTEKHHIIPVSLGGKNIRKNLVRLTVREHLLAHRLLIRFLLGMELVRMSHAYYRMMKGRQGKYLKMTSRSIKECEKEYSRARSAIMKGRKHSPQAIENMKLAWKIRCENSVPMPESSRMKISIANKGRLLGLKRPKEFGEKISRSLKGKKKTKEHVEKINKNPEKIAKTAEKHRGMKRSEESKEKMRIAALRRLERSGGPWNKGMKMDDPKYMEVRKRMSESAKKRVMRDGPPARKNTKS
jgi:hypothetical protein